MLLVDTGGVGYEMEAPMTTFYDLPATGEPVTLYLHHIVREDAQHLYAFARRAERDVFRQLLRVSGVGAKLGLAILSGLDAGGFARCVLEGDTREPRQAARHRQEDGAASRDGDARQGR